VGINGEWYNVQYEGLHLICTQCGCYGHILKDCTAQQKIATFVPEETTTPVTAAPEIAAVTVTSENGKEVIAGNVSSENSEGIIKENPVKTDSIYDEPDFMHGEWIKVERKKRSNKANQRGVGGDTKFPFQKLRNRINELNELNTNSAHGNRSVLISNENDGGDTQRITGARIWKNKQKRTRGDIGPSKISPSNGRQFQDTSPVGVYKGGYTATIKKVQTKIDNIASRGAAVRNLDKKDSHHPNSGTELNIKDGKGNFFNGLNLGDASQRHAAIPPQKDDINLVNDENGNKDQDNISTMEDANDRSMGHSHNSQMHIN
jgi:hypothetical protein